MTTHDHARAEYLAALDRARYTVDDEPDRGALHDDPTPSVTRSPDYEEGYAAGYAAVSRVADDRMWRIGELERIIRSLGGVVP